MLVGHSTCYNQMSITEHVHKWELDKVCLLKNHEEVDLAGLQSVSKGNLMGCCNSIVPLLYSQQKTEYLVGHRSLR